MRFSYELKFIINIRRSVYKFAKTLTGNLVAINTHYDYNQLDKEKTLKRTINIGNFNFKTKIHYKKPSIHVRDFAL